MAHSDGAAEIFQRVMNKLKARVGTDVFNSWFVRMKLAEGSKSVVRLSVPTPFLRTWISSHYLKDIEALWREDNPDLMRLDVIVRSATRIKPVADKADAAVRPVQTQRPGRVEAAPSPAPAGQPAAGERSVFGSPLDKRYTFANFVSGEPNQIAWMAAKTVAESPNGAVRFNPLYVHSSVGLGKTHLLQAIAWAVIARAPKSKVVYLTAEYFMYRFAAAIRDNQALAMKEQLRDIDLLIIDDMQFMQGNMIQHEFCHLINSLLDSAKQVVVAADRPASELESLDERMKSRLLGGMSVDMRTPDQAMRLAMLRSRLEAAKAEDAALDIPDDILQHVARRVSGSGREIEGAFNQLMFRRSFENELSTDRVDDIIAQYFRSSEARRVRIEDIQRVVARHYNVPRAELVSARRTRTIVRPRQVAMYLCKVMTPRSLPEIGRRFGNRDHTTVLHAVRKIEGLAAEEPGLRRELDVLQQMIEEQAGT